MPETNTPQTAPAQTPAEIIAEANALFPQLPARYTLGIVPEGHPAAGRWRAVDTVRGRTVGQDADPLKVARKALVSARLSLFNGNRRYMPGEEPVGRTVSLQRADWDRVDAALKARGVTLTEFLLSLGVDA